jgi:hypothetical protein
MENVELSEMTVKEMKKYASEQLGQDISSSIVTRDAVIEKIEAIWEHNRKQLEKEKKQIKSNKPFASDPKRKVAFINVENPGGYVEFDYEGYYAKLRDGHEYELPEPVIRHLETRRYPNYKPSDSEGISMTQDGWVYRFAFRSAG